MSMADAIKNEACASTRPAFERRLLEKVHEHASRRAKHCDSGFDVVARVRTELCSVCRGIALYCCDQQAGWSERCTLMRENQSC